MQAFVSQLAREYLKVHKSWRLQAQPQLVIVYAEVGSGLTDGVHHSFPVGAEMISYPWRLWRKLGSWWYAPYFFEK